jgi:hypothetical protein
MTAPRSVSLSFRQVEQPQKMSAAQKAKSNILVVFMPFSFLSFVLCRGYSVPPRRTLTIVMELLRFYYQSSGL